jgi:hypothetical protein
MKPTGPNLLSQLHAGLQGLLCLTAPLSVEYPLWGDFRLSMPGEGLALLLAPIIALRVGLSVGQQSAEVRAAARDPFVWATGLSLGTLLLAAFFSTLPTVSAKYLLAEGLHLWVFLLGAALLLRDDPGHLKKGFLLAAAGTTVAALYVLYRHAGYGFQAEFTTITPRPFFPDDTMYSALLWMALPTLCGWALYQRRALWWCWAALLLFALWAARCRGAWLGGAAIVGLGGLLYLRTSPPILLGLALAGALAGAALWPTVQGALREKGDVSLLERLNRYSCALRMAADRPLTGHGPGTYQFAYLSYQLPEERTRISVDRAGTEQEGRGGEAHSEYLQRLADAGWPGLLGLLGWIGAFFFGGAKKIYRSNPAVFSQQNILRTTLWLAVMGYWVHGLTNNFLHTDKVAVWVMGAMAAVMTDHD